MNKGKMVYNTMVILSLLALVAGCASSGPAGSQKRVSKVQIDEQVFIYDLALRHYEGQHYDQAAETFEHLVSKTSFPELKAKAAFGLACARTVQATNWDDFEQSFQDWHSWLKIVNQNLEVADPGMLGPVETHLERVHGERQGVLADLQEKNRELMQELDTVEADRDKLEFQVQALQEYLFIEHEVNTYRARKSTRENRSAGTVTRNEEKDETQASAGMVRSQSSASDAERIQNLTNENERLKEQLSSLKELHKELLSTRKEVLKP